ncbi:MAG: phage holin family protein [Proteobacteria bacterium]|nr:phage holin family protein [Pseudomonadota bacterium]
MMIELLILLAIAAIAPQIFPGIKVKSLGTAALVAVVFAMINFFLGWLLTLVLTIVSIPAIILTLGAFTVFIPTLVNAILLRMVDAVLEDFEIAGWAPAIGMGLLFALGGWAANAIT